MFYLILGSYFFGLIFSIYERKIYYIVFCLIGTSVFSYILYQGRNYDDELKKITNEPDILSITTFSSITNFAFTKGVAEKIDSQFEKNATCMKDVCVYTGTIQRDGPAYALTLLSQQNIVFQCTVQNNCKLSSYVEHGVKYLKVSTN